MFKKLKTIGTKMKIASASVTEIFDAVVGPVKRYCLSILFALFFEIVGTGAPARPWLAVAMYPLLRVGSIVKWGTTGYALYLLFFHGIHMPLWLTVFSLLTSGLLVVALAAAKMEYQHHEYLTSK
jgi:uncharacterized membrane protein